MEDYSMSSLFSVSKEDISRAATCGVLASSSQKDLDFVSIFPTELSEKLLFKYLPVKDIMNCSRCCLSWRNVLNNSFNWQQLCIRHGYISTDFQNSGTDEFQKLSKPESHVDPTTNIRFKLSPRFSLPPVASPRIESLCPWGLYFRQCRHLQLNWMKGFVIHKLVSQSNTGICRSASSNDGLVALASDKGSVYIWSSLGVPKLIHTIPAIRFRVEAQKVKLVNDFIIVVYMIGVIRIFKYAKCDKSTLILSTIAQIKVRGVPVNEIMFTLNAADISEEVFPTVENVQENDVEEWIRELFREEPWFIDEMLATSDTYLLTNKEYLVFTGLSCNCFLVWKIKSGELVRKVVFPTGYQLCYCFQLTEEKAYFSTRRLFPNNEQEPSFSILIYRLEDMSDVFDKISVHSVVEEIQVHPEDLQKLVWLTQDSIFFIRHNQESQDNPDSVIRKQADSYVDTLEVYKHYILYHEYDGIVVCLNWEGETLYKTTCHTGVVRGLACHKDFLITGGDVRQLCIWNVHTGEKLYEVFHQPSRINYLFVHDTKIITLGVEDEPVLIGFW